MRVAADAGNASGHRIAVAPSRRYAGSGARAGYECHVCRREQARQSLQPVRAAGTPAAMPNAEMTRPRRAGSCHGRSEEHTSELQSQSNLVCRLLLEKKTPGVNELVRVYVAQKRKIQD